MGVELAPHQITAMRGMKNGCIVKGGVGTGKSRTALAYFLLRECRGSVRVNGKGTTRAPENPLDLYIFTTKKKRDSLDWEEEAASFSLSRERDSSLGGIKVTVDTWNNIQKYEDVENAFFIFDEQRLVGNGAWVQAFYKIAKNNRWILLSATPGDNWMDYVPVFIANGFYRNRTEFIRTHVVYKPFAKFAQIDRFVETKRLEELRAELVVDMPYDRHTTRHIKNVLVDFHKEKFDTVWKHRWNIYEEKPIRDVAEMFRVARKLVNTDPSRLGAIMELMESHPRLIIFYNFDYELEILRTLADLFHMPVAEWNGHRHDDLPDANAWFYLVQYTAGAEGWNCTETDAIVFYSLNYSYKLNEQARGRIDRLNTKYIDLFYYILRSGAPVDQAIIRALATKKNFNEKEYERDFAAGRELQAAA